MSYQIPATLPAELDELASLIERHRNGQLDAASLKARRVPFGCYEQRKDGTYMVRIRTTGGALTPLQLAAIARLSSRYGAASIHITTRQEFQIHDVALENVVAVMRALLDAGLATRGGGGNTVRNIIVSPDAGVTIDEPFDPSPYAFALTTRLIAEPDSWVLPRKYKIAFSNSAVDTAYAQFNDLGFIADTRDGVQGFQVYVAGGLGSNPEVAHRLHDFVPAGDSYLVAEAIKRLFDKHGNRKNKNAARLRFLWKQLGEERFRELYEAELQSLRLTHPDPLTPAALPVSRAAPPFAPVENESTEFRAWYARYCYPQPQNGLYSVLVPVLLGNLNNEDLLALAEFLGGFGDDVVRATFGQNLRLRNMPEAYLGNVYALLRRISELTTAPALLANSIACTGADTCKLGVCLPKGALQAVTRKLLASDLDLDQIADFKLNLSGCPNTCGQHITADLGFYGIVGRKNQQMYPAYGVVAGARIGNAQPRLALNIERVSSRNLPEFVADVLKLWIEKKPRFSSFAEYIDREGTEDIHSLAARYHDIPEFENDKNYYYDWGASEAFSLVGKGVGECSAGLFDLIEVDLKQAEDLRQKLSNGLPHPERDEILHGIVLCSSRALLVTRGIEAPSEETVFAAFEKHFIGTGLVEARFRPLLRAARDKDFSALGEAAAEVFALAEAVHALYVGMDNSLRFPTEKASPTAAPTPVMAERDYRGVACPMNFVKVKLDLSRLRNGERIQVLLDDGVPIENVPRSVEQEGHKVLSQQKRGTFWAVVIEKRD
jgi:sulfite reductase (ferredoxin)